MTFSDKTKELINREIDKVIQEYIGKDFITNEQPLDKWEIKMTKNEYQITLFIIVFFILIYVIIKEDLNAGK